MVVTQPSASEQAGTVPEKHELLVAAPSALAHRTGKEEMGSYRGSLGDGDANGHALGAAGVPRGRDVAPRTDNCWPLAPALFL